MTQPLVINPDLKHNLGLTKKAAQLKVYQSSTDDSLLSVAMIDRDMPHQGAQLQGCIRLNVRQQLDLLRLLTDRLPLLLNTSYEDGHGVGYGQGYEVGKRHGAAE